MGEKHNELSSTKSQRTIDSELVQFEEGLTGFLDSVGLPSKGILADIRQRGVAIGNAGQVVEQLSPEQLQQSVYLSKFFAAVASGLFDAALNFLWNETIQELRSRIVQYDVSYFFDNAGLSSEKRKRVSTESDLDELNDSELIRGAKAIGLISDVGYQHLDYIRYMRNWVSAAHPNQGRITGLQLVSWLETCIQEVMMLPLSSATIEIGRLLAWVRTSAMSESDAREVATFFLGLNEDQIDTLSAGLFGIYTRRESDAIARDNVLLLVPHLWGRVSEGARQGFGVRYGRFTIGGDIHEKHAAREFLEHVSGLQYIPDDLKAAEMEGAIEDLLNAHKGMNNFYIEPTFARQLQRLVGSHGRVPEQMSSKYVHGLVEVFLTNGHGVAWDAEPIYLDLLGKLDSRQALLAVLSFREDVIASRLQFSLPKQKFAELLDLMKQKSPNPAVREVIDAIEQSGAPLDKMRNDTRMKERISSLLGILE